MRVDINFVKKYTSIKYKSIKYISLIKHERVRTYVLVFQFFIKISAVDLRLSLKNCCSYFRVTFSKTSCGILLRGCWSWRSCTYAYVLTCSEIIPTAADKTATGRIYTSLVVWMHVQWLPAGYSEDVHIRLWHTKA